MTLLVPVYVRIIICKCLPLYKHFFLKITEFSSSFYGTFCKTSLKVALDKNSFLNSRQVKTKMLVQHLYSNSSFNLRTSHLKAPRVFVVLLISTFWSNDHASLIYLCGGISCYSGLPLHHLYPSISDKYWGMLKLTWILKANNWIRTRSHLIEPRNIKLCFKGKVCVAITVIDISNVSSRNEQLCITALLVCLKCSLP